MDEVQKKSLLAQAKQHVERVGISIFEAKESLEINIAKLRKELIRASGEERDIQEGILYFQLEKQKMLGDQNTSPYFFRCDVIFDDNKKEETLYIGKFPFVTEAIYSWVAPVSSIRFEHPGRFTYSTPYEGTRSGQLLRKDQFMIVDKKIIFMSTETTQFPRELIYQEYFSQKKTEFVLPEIVEQMEKAQDIIIRSHYFGSFLISGPAGSGKTTLALHKLAYLIQSPDTSTLFPPKKVIVFVQDMLTKKYFAGLLPQLGITNVKIVTFEEWAKEILHLQDIKFAPRLGNNEEQSDLYELHKSEALTLLSKQKGEREPYTLLKKVYKSHLSDKEMKLFQSQIAKRVMDRFDLTILLKVSLRQNGSLQETVSKWNRLQNGRYVKRTIQQPITYAGIILDEAENYLAEQIEVIKSCIDQKTQAMIYVGDLVQQTLLFTIRDWSQANEQFDDSRKVTLQKVYRNTRQILEYIRSLGYLVEIPNEIRDGEKVEEILIERAEDGIRKVTTLIDPKSDELVGIIAKSSDLLTKYQVHFSDYKNVHVLTINEAQGVEFNTVFLIKRDEQRGSIKDREDQVQKERERVDRDLQYVALTRAMNKLYVIKHSS